MATSSAGHVKCLLRLGVCCSLLLFISARTTAQTREELFRFLAGLTRLPRGSTPDSGGTQLEFVSGNLSSLVESAVVRLSDHHSGLLLIHRLTTGKYTDTVDSLNFLRERNATLTVPLSAPLYSSLSAISHLPVSVVVTLIPEATTGATATLSDSSREKLQEIQSVLEEASQLVQDGAFEDEVQSHVFPGLPASFGRHTKRRPSSFASRGHQTKLEVGSARQARVTEVSMNFISKVLSGTENATLTALQTFAQSLSSDLRTNAKEAVRDYLTCLNSTITDLLSSGTITEAEWRTVRVAIPVDPFTKTSDFVVQYYQWLLGNSPDPRVTILPTLSQRHSLHQFNDSLAESQHQYAFSNVMETLTQTFSDSMNRLSSPHEFLSDAASELVCTELYVPFCNETAATDDHSEKLPPGFETQAERAYVIVVIYTGTLAAVLLIILSCVCLEGRKMKIERRSEADVCKVPNVFTPPIPLDAHQSSGGEQSESAAAGNGLRTADSSLEAVTHTEVTL